MKKKYKNSRSSNGIMVCDSIVMSVKKKRFNMRKFEAVAIAVAGYAAALMVFLKMFDFTYNRLDLTIAAVLLSAIYITLSLIGKKTIWVISVSSAAVMAVAYKFIDTIAMGYKFVYNVIYKSSYHTEIMYYKFLDGDLEERSVTVFFIFCAWMIAVLVYMFTIYHPNAIPPLLVTFPILEVGLYNGISVSVFWGMLLVSYWLALLAMTAIDMGEYSGGTGGFVRKDNLFFPKRQMRLKVTEKCGVYIIISVMLVTGITQSVMKATGYKRSDELNVKRVDIRDAVNSFSMEDVSGSISNITEAFGFALKVQTHKLGNVDRLRYRNSVDLVVDFDRIYDGAVYLKEFNGSVYSNNEWSQLPGNVYDDALFRDFSKYDFYPQDFGGAFSGPIRSNLIDLALDSDSGTYRMTIDSKLKGNRSFAPYYTMADGILDHDRDCTLTSKSNGKNKYSYQFADIDIESITRLLDVSSRNSYSFNNVRDSAEKEKLGKYCRDKGLLDNSSYIYVDTEFKSNTHVAYSYPELILAELMQEDYERFVYDNYLQLPDDTNMAEIRALYADIFNNASPDDTAARKIKTLEDLRLAVAMNAEYSLDPGRTPSNRDFVNYFLTENKKGYCVHYATTGVVLARLAGIPARYASGYVIVGDDFNNGSRNDDGSYTIKVKDNRSHAWVEVYLSGFGWVPFEFTAGYTEDSIETTPTTTSAETTTDPSATTTADDTEASSNSSENRTTNERSTTTTAVTITTIVTGGGNGEGEKTIPASVKQMIRLLLIIAAVVLIVLIRCRLILRARNRHFNEGSSVQRMANIYDYTERLLAFIDVRRGELTYTDYADRVEKDHGGSLFGEGEFRSLMDDALRASFSEEPPSKDQLAQHIRFSRQLAEKVYARSGKAAKFCMKYILVLIR